MKRCLLFTLLAASLASCGVALCAGCHRRGTTAQRAQSMATLRAEGVDTDQLRALVVARSGLLSAGDRFVRLYRDDGEERGSTMLGETSYGMAALITPDGYALTAAHCVRGRPVVVVYVQKQGPDGRQAYPAEARTVWVGNPKGFGGDLALLKLAPTADLHHFTWAPDERLSPGSQVVLAGQQNDKPGNPLTLAAGRLRERPAPHAVSHDNAKMTLLAFDAPGRNGDSGGPLTDASGALVGIVVGYFAPFTAPGYGVAVRPDLEWLDRLIRQDRRDPETRAGSSTARSREASRLGPPSRVGGPP